MLSFFFKSKKRRRLEKEGLAGSKKRLKQDETLGHAMNKSRFVSFIILTVIWLFCAFVLILPSDSNKFEFYLVENQQAPKTIHSDFDFAFLNKTATEQKSLKHKASVPLIFEINTAICKERINKAQELLEDISINPKYTDSKTGKALGFPPSFIPLLLTIFNDPKKMELFNEKLSTTLYRGIISPEALTNRKSNTKICIIDNSNNHMRPSQPLYSIPTPTVAANNFSYEVALDYSPQNRQLLRKALYKFAIQFLSENLIFNKQLSEFEQNIASNAVENNVYKEIFKGDIILKKGQKITPSVLLKFKAYETELHKHNIYVNFWSNFAYNLIVTLILVIIIGIYFNNLHRKILQSNKKMAIIGIVIIISVFCILFADKFFYILATEYNLPPNLKTCLIPLGLTSILLSVLIGLRAATFASLLVALVAAIKLDSYFVVILSMGISCISAHVVYKSKNYKEYFIRAAISVSLLFVVMELIGQLKVLIHNPETILLLLGLCIINGLITASISLAILFCLESVFQINTDMSLLSLCDYNHPLLKRLQLEAPGTYHHCLVVATLAEQAASDMGANPIKARVCALFHDIGKLSKPQYFSENNIGTKNRHVLLRPGMSCMIIMNHVKEGVNLAIKYKLSHLIRSAIQQHHGTDLVYYFYRRALDENNIKTRDITESEYRYPGPKPYVKEIVLVSLADSCEAASRALVKPTPSKVEALVWEIIRKRIREGQLDNADFTFKELAIAKKSFIKTLNSMLHTRINYPVEEEQENEGDLFYAAKEHAKSSEKRIPTTNEKNSRTS